MILREVFEKIGDRKGSKSSRERGVENRSVIRAVLTSENYEVGDFQPVELHTEIYTKCHNVQHRSPKRSSRVPHSSMEQFLWQHWLTALEHSMGFWFRHSDLVPVKSTG